MFWNAQEPYTVHWKHLISLNPQKCANIDEAKITGLQDKGNAKQRGKDVGRAGKQPGDRRGKENRKC